MPETVPLPPGAAAERGWRWVFPATTLSLDRRTGVRHRPRLHESVIARALAAVSRRAGGGLRVTSHAFRHSFTAHLLEDGYDIRTVQELLGHKDVKTTMMYTHVLNRGPKAVRSPLDRPGD